jgi:polycystin 1L2
VYWYLIGLIVFLSNIKFLRLLRFNKHISQFAGTLKHARKDLMYFSVTFIVIFMAFTSSGFLIFNRYSHDYSSVMSVMQSLYGMLVGHFDYREMAKADR